MTTRTSTAGAGPAVGMIGLLAALALTAPPPASAQAPDGASSPLAPGSGLLHPQSEDEDLRDPVAELAERLERGVTTLPRDPEWGYLPAVLEALDVPLSSQSLVFSRTSLQVDMIAPWAPRAIYFNDDVYVGYTVDGLVLEIAAVDPDGGSVFYTIDQRDADDPGLRLDDLTCKGCHETGITGGVPGVMMRSFLTDRMGNTVTPIQERPVDDRTPMAVRFGGWYVTGTHSLPHAGNVRAEPMVHEIDRPEDFLEGFDTHAGGNVVDLAGHFEQSFYLGEGSDIVALMVLAHQTRVHNLITIAAEGAQEALRELELMRLGSGADLGLDALPEATHDRLDYEAELLVRGMLFYRAEPIGEVRGTSGFAEEFAARGPRDGRGRSLRDFSLDGRLFEYPLSFLIYSDAWDALPELVKTRAYRRMHELLTGGDSPDYPLLDAERRAAVLEILLETKPDFAAFATSL